MAHSRNEIETIAHVTSTNRCTTFNESLLRISTLRKDHVLDQAVALALLMASTYLTMSVSFYEVQNWHRRKKFHVNQLSSIAAALNFAYSMRIVMDILGPLPAIQGCRALNYFGAACFVSINSLLYTVLWARQLKFYSDPLLIQSFTKTTRIFSHALILLIYSSVFALVALFQTSICVMTTKIGCVNMWVTAKTKGYLFTSVTSFMVVCFTCQLVLFILITRPLVSVNRNLCCVNFSWKSQEEIQTMVRRLVLSTSACILINMIMCVFILLDAYRIVRSYWINWIGMDLLLNNVAVILSFADWRERLFYVLRDFIIGLRKRSFSNATIKPLSETIRS